MIGVGLPAGLADLYAALNLFNLGLAAVARANLSGASLRGNIDINPQRERGMGACRHNRPKNRYLSFVPNPANAASVSA